MENNEIIYQGTTESGITVTVYRVDEDRKVLDLFMGKIANPNAYVISVSATEFQFYTTFHKSTDFDDINQIINSSYVIRKAEDNESVKDLDNVCSPCGSSENLYRVPCVEGNPLQHICIDCLEQTIEEIDSIPSHKLVIPEL